MKRLKLKFRSKMLLWIIGAVVIISGGVQYYINYNTSNIVLGLEEKFLDGQLQGIKTNIEDNFETDKIMVKLLTKKNDLIKGLSTNNSKDLEHYEQYLAEIVAGNDKIEIAVVADEAGKIVAASNSQALGIDISDRGYFQEAIKGNMVLSNPIKSKLSNEVIFGISSPVKANDKIVGVLYVANRVEFIYNKMIKPVKVGKTGYGFIATKDMLVLAHPNKDIVFNEELSKQPFMLAIKEKINSVKNGRIQYWYEPTKAYKTTFVRELSNGWYLCFTVDEDELLEVLDTTKAMVLLSGIVLIVGIGLVVYILIGSVAKVIKILNELMRDLAVGRISNISERQIAINSALLRNDEFGEMTQAVLDMQGYFKDMSDVALSVAKKDLNVNVKVRGKDDILGHSIKQMIDNFNDALTQVSLSVSQVSQGASQVSSASQDLSAGAIEQVTHIEKISTSVSNLQVKTNSNAENAENANIHATEANNAAIKGQEQMENLSKAMQGMSGRASEVQKIIKTIDDIAFQTNLLALNAAVEAARAGTHGKGFAVVAEEVRNLAARSAKAAGETAELIANVVNEIDSGNKLTEVTAESLNSIADAIGKASDLVAEIAASMVEQTGGMKEISGVLEQIEHVTQTNSASSEETASASEEMSGMSYELKKLVSEFKLLSVAAEVPIKSERKSTKKVLSSSNHLILPLGNDAELVKPEEEIKLDDSEFGKF